jgi:hypothetical protein
MEIILDMVQHRGYFDRLRGCAEVDEVLRRLDVGLNRVVVGHTPHDFALELCHGKLLASDSSLSRSFRAHGNMYCPLRKSLEDYRGGRTCSNKVHNDICEGSISRITRSSANDPWPASMQRFQFHELKSMGSGTSIIRAAVETGVATNIVDDHIMKGEEL